MADQIYILKDDGTFDDDSQPKIRPFNVRRISERTIDELLGLSKGLIADGALSEVEVRFLAGWVHEHRDLTQGWSFRIIEERVSKIMLDGKITEEERVDLFSLLAHPTGTRSHNSLHRDHPTSLPLTRPMPAVEFEGRAFCFTGKFFFGTRKSCELSILAKGATIHSDVCSGTDFLVIGSLGSRDWMHSSHGRKIEAAIGWNSKGSTIAIVDEEHWIKSIAGA
jgi:NAD-dependent DNA ligase